MFSRLFGKKKKQPNIVMILLDQFRNDARLTHSIFDALKKRGVLFSKTITYAPYTLGSLHATFTGMYGRDNGVDAYAKSDCYRKKECFSLTQYLKRQGYYTRGYTFSKILLPDSGFDQFTVVGETEEKDILKSHLSELDICFGQDSPFFCYLHYGEIHHEIVKQVIRKYDDFAPDYFDHYKKNHERYMAIAEKAGEHTEKLLERIDQYDPDNTMIIVLTDHGAGVGEKPGEKAYGIFTYDYSIRIWSYLIYPELLPQDREIDTQIRTIDILPTVLDLLGIKPNKKTLPVKGRSLMPIIRGDESEHRGAFSETGGVEGPYPSPDASNIKCYRDGRWKLILNTTTNKYELYDLESDPGENINLYFDHQEQAQALFRHLSEHL